MKSRLERNHQRRVKEVMENTYGDKNPLATDGITEVIDVVAMADTMGDKLPLDKEATTKTVLSREDRQKIKAMYDQYVRDEAKKQSSQAQKEAKRERTNRFLNRGIIALALLLVLILAFAFIV